MKFVALLSGGKDSCYNIVHCTANGHELVAAASLKPPAGQGEIDSFMYQTVGQDAIEFVAEALDVPLFRRTIHGSAVEQGGDYGDRVGKADRENEGVNGDETEDMFALLSEVKEAYPDIQGVSVGAILSNYQRVRVDHVCQRLDLTPLCYLWQRDQRELMSEMVAAGVEAILIKVAGIGLNERHLGKTLAQMQPIFHKLNDQFGAHICGEGGEYETLTLDCPAFKKRIIIKETEIVVHSDHAFATVAYLQIKDAVLEDKPQTAQLTPTIPPLLDTFATQMEQSLSGQQALLNQEPHPITRDPTEHPLVDAQVVQRGDWMFVSNVQCNAPTNQLSIEDEIVSCLEAIRGFLGTSDLSLQPKHIVNTMLLLSDMALFPRVNKAYAQYFGTSPPSRACVAVDLPEGIRIRVSCVAYKDHPVSNPRSGLHVQGISYWAPANIGPYSQAITAQGQTFISGQIGLVPARMEFPYPPSFATEAALAFQHAERILDALKDGSTSVLQSVIVWVAGEDKLELGRRAWNAYTQTSKRGDIQIPAIVVAAKSLPKGAMIEVQVLAHSSDSQQMDSDGDDDNHSDAGSAQISSDTGTGVDYEYNIRRIGKMSPLVLAFANNGGVLNGLFASCPLLQDETLTMIVFYCPSADRHPCEGGRVLVAAIITEPTGRLSDTSSPISIGPFENHTEEYGGSSLSQPQSPMNSRCWIPAQEGQKFEIRWVAEAPDSSAYRSMDLLATPYLNGVKMDSGVLMAAQWTNHEYRRLDGHQVRKDEACPFQFGRLQVTGLFRDVELPGNTLVSIDIPDDDSMVDLSVLPEDLNTIRIVLEWGRISKRPQRRGKRSRRRVKFSNPKVKGLVHEQNVKNGNLTSAALEDLTPSEIIPEVHIFKPEPSIPPATFYSAMRLQVGATSIQAIYWLQARGIIVADGGYEDTPPASDDEVEAMITFDCNPTRYEVKSEPGNEAAPNPLNEEGVYIYETMAPVFNLRPLSEDIKVKLEPSD